MAIKSCTSNSFDDAYMPMKALAVYSGLSVRTLRSYLTHPSYPLACYQIGGKVLVRRSDFDLWATQFRVVRSTANLEELVSDVVSGLR